MTTVSKDVERMTLEAFSRYLAMGKFLAASNGLRAFEFGEQWQAELQDRQRLLHRLARGGNHEAQRQSLQNWQLNCCMFECLSFVCWQRQGGVEGSNLAELRMQIDGLLAVSDAEERSKLQAVKRQLMSFNPFKAGKRDYNRWLARQDELLFDSGIPRAQLRAFRGEPEPQDSVDQDRARRRGISLGNRVRGTTKQSQFDRLLPEKSRLVRDAARRMLREHSSSPSD